MGLVHLHGMKTPIEALIEARKRWGLTAFVQCNIRYNVIEYTVGWTEITLEFEDQKIEFNHIKGIGNSWCEAFLNSNIVSFQPSLRKSNRNR